MNIDFASIERKARWTVGCATLAALAMSASWRLIDSQARPAFEAMAASMPTPAVILDAGYRIQVGSQVAQVFGDDEYDCDLGRCKGVKIEPGVDKDVLLASAGKLWRERWTFKREGEKLMAIRPNGEFVMAADRK